MFEHTLQKQVAKQSEEIGALKGQIAEIGALKDQIAELTATLKGVTLAPATAPVTNNGNNTNNSNSNNTTTNNSINQTTTININPWGREFYIPAEALEAVFAESETLQRYCRIGDKARTDPEEAAPYVQEALINLVKHQHRDPRERNVHLNPKRNDQVLIFDTMTWQILPLVEAIRSLFDRIANGIRKTTIPTYGQEWKKLTPDVQKSATWLPHMYDQDRERHIIRAKASMSAHLANMALGKTLPAPPQVISVEEERRKPEFGIITEIPPADLPAEQAPKKAQPKPFIADDAAALFRATKAGKGESRAAYAKRLFEGAREQDPSRIMTKLWEAQEDGKLSDSEAAMVRELVTEYDAGKI